MNSISKYVFAIAFFSLTFSVMAGTVLESSWSDVARGRCSDQTSAWWSSDEAIRIARNVLLYQREIGGWQKNTNFQLVLSQSEKDALIAAKPKNADCTIDNGAVTYELMYLSRVYAAVSDATVKSEIETGFLKGINYLLEAQYDNGGWPQFYPYRGGYSNHITYNDDAMVNVMGILRHVYLKDSNYSIKADDALAAKAREAFDKGLECMLNTQYMRHGQLKAWCAQHHYQTLEPALARSYELPSMSGYESAGIIKLLISIDNPSKAIKRAIFSSSAWYDESRIKGQKLVSFVNADGLNDKKIVFDANAADMWARFYTLEDNRPFFCDRDGVKKYTIAEIGHERRNGYSWYGSSGFDVISSFNNWLNKWDQTMLVSPVPGISVFNTDTVKIKAVANKHTGKTFEKLELIIDGKSVVTTAQNLDTAVMKLSPGDHTFILNATYAGGLVQSDTSTFTVTQPTFNLKVVGGEGSGDYYEGSVVGVTANEPPAGKTFSKWIGDTEYLEDPNSASTNAIMPAEGIRVTAIYRSIALANDNFNEEILVYPNPVNDELTIDLKGKGSAQIQIINLAGLLVMKRQLSADLHQVNVSNLHPGQYILSVHMDDHSILSYKLLKAGF